MKLNLVYVFDDDKMHVAEISEYGLSDSDTDKYSVQVQNGEGYYDDFGKYVSYHIYD